MKRLIKLFKSNGHLFLIAALPLLFFWQTFFRGKMPIPSDTIVGMYHPWRDVIWNGYTSGVPFKNFLITDPVRQQYVWRKLAIEEIKRGKVPLWNPYSFSGTPLLANFQSAVFYPLNILFLIFPFNLSWTILIVLEPLLAGIFLYLYLSELKISKTGSLIGAIAFSFSGFSVAWLEWNTVLHTILWLPLILLSINKVLGCFEEISNIKYQRSNIKKILSWSSVFTFSLISSFFAGHLQIFFYVFIITVFYLLFRIISLKEGRIKEFLLFAFCFLLFAMVTSIQWFPTLRFINLSGRAIDQAGYLQEGWFIPWQNLVQFMAPDFFGNPATLNYWGIWNYGEFAGFVGIIPLILALYALLFRFDRKVTFFGSLLFLSLLFSLPTPLAKLPYILRFPFLSTSQPTRLISVIVLSLTVLSALGLDQLLKDRKRIKIWIVSVPLALIILFLWLIIYRPSLFNLDIKPEYLLVSRSNLILPTISFIAALAILNLLSYPKKVIRKTALFMLFILLTAELFRFWGKFTPFTDPKWLFPKTQVTEFLRNVQKPFRIMAVNREIFPPDFSVFYEFEDVSGYDPLYLKSYAELVSSWNSNKGDLSSASFNRIITPQNYSSKIADIMNVKYVLSLNDEPHPKLKLVLREGETRVYENLDVIPRAFFVRNILWEKDRQKEADLFFGNNFDMAATAVIEDTGNADIRAPDSGRAVFSQNETGKFIIDTENNEDGFLLVSQIFYPSWHAVIRKQGSKSGSETKIYKTDLSLMGIFVPKGKNTIEFYISL